MKVVKVGTRGSRLAVAQTNWVIEELEKHYPEVSFEVVVIKTTGDRIQDVSVEKIGDKGVFVKEIEMALLSGEIDLAVHSMKDMPSEKTSGLIFTSSPKREDPRDVLILRAPYESLADLPQGAVIGTGSKRRRYQLLGLRPDLDVVPIRGNIDTRIKKIETENLDGIILAAAGLKRIGKEEVITEYLPMESFIPAPAQGALALQIRESDEEMAKMARILTDELTNLELSGERSFLGALGGTCHQPIGAKAFITSDHVRIVGLFGNSEGFYATEEISGDVADIAMLGTALGKSLKKKVENHGR